MKKVFMLVAMLVSFSVSAQDTSCVQDERPHFFMATGTFKTTIPDSLEAVLTDKEKLIWTSTVQTEIVIGPEQGNLQACKDALGLLEAQRNILPKKPIHVLQSVSYKGIGCVPVSHCPAQ